MKLFYLLTFSLAFYYSSTAQLFNLSVQDGYGSGQYYAGDTVHIWSVNNPANNVFGKWTSADMAINDPYEWHTTLVMPPRDILVSAAFRSVNLPVINYEKIRGVNNLKNVYWAFPENYKAVVMCFHGTGGSAQNWTMGIEYRQFVNDLLADTFAVIITEAEEVTLQQDLNSDGGLRWSPYPVDPQTNIDIANIKVLTDTFRLRGLTHASTRYFAVGMSNGGAFAPTVSYALNFSGTAVYCASGSSLFFSQTTVPTIWNMQKYDQHENVGADGNADALAHSNLMNNRGICSEYHLNDRSPVHPERFMRGGYITQGKAAEIFKELKQNTLLDTKNYLLYTDLQADSIIKANPQQYPVFNSLFPGQQLVVLTHLASCYADHQFFSDYNRKTINFFNNFCASSTGIGADVYNELIEIYPNPASGALFINLQTPAAITITNIAGQVISQCDVYRDQMLDISSWPPGTYYITASYPGGRFTKYFIKE